MNIKELPIMRIRHDAILPTYGSDAAAGMDLYATITESDIGAENHKRELAKKRPLSYGQDEKGFYVSIPNGETVFIHTGIASAIPSGYVGLIYARSGLACKTGLAPANKVGVIDADYRGEIIVALHNHNESDLYLDNDDKGELCIKTIPSEIKIYHGDRIAQMAIQPVEHPSIVEVNELPTTERGEGGFGSTGTN